MDYFDDLGVNAIWITAPYEQVHGWVSGGGAFPHYAFHGYYTLDWTFMDKNMGTISEFRTFVNEAHSRGIRVVIDIVLNHAGYNTLEDMITYDFGSTTVTTHGWIDGGASWTNNHAVTDYSSPRWDRWWSSWVRAFDGNWGYEPPEGGDLKMSLAGLPDVVTEKTGSYTIPTFLQVKWDAENNASYDDWRLTRRVWTPPESGHSPRRLHHQVAGCLGRGVRHRRLRVDTAKHVDMYRWASSRLLRRLRWKPGGRAPARTARLPRPGTRISG
jgi:alpha-amylase